MDIAPAAVPVPPGSREDEIAVEAQRRERVRRFVIDTLDRRPSGLSVSITLGPVEIRARGWDGSTDIAVRSAPQVPDEVWSTDAIANAAMLLLGTADYLNDQDEG